MTISSHRGTVLLAILLALELLLLAFGRVDEWLISSCTAMIPWAYLGPFAALLSRSGVISMAMIILGICGGLLLARPSVRARGRLLMCGLILIGIVYFDGLSAFTCQCAVISNGDGQMRDVCGNVWSK